MSVLVVGLSHRSAPVGLLERVAVFAEDAPKVLHELCDSPAVGEALVLSTCNRVEVYANVAKFHAGVSDVSELLARHSGVALDELSDHLYVHYEDSAVAHLFTVACGLDSMAVGEAQVLGQLRAAYDVARSEAATGRVLHELCQHALRVGKRAHTDTGIDRVAVCLVGAGLDLGVEAVGPLDGRSALVVGAGSMSALAATTLRRRAVGDLVIANRTPATAARLAATLDGRAVGLGSVEQEITRADVVVSCTGATDVVLPHDLLDRAVAARGARPLFVLDLALPRDVAPGARSLPGVTLTDLEALRGVLADSDTGAEVDAVREIVAEEVAAFLAWERAVLVAPTVVALRSKAADVVDAELLRLAGRLPDLDERARAEVAASVRRVVDKLLHAPTVRVQSLAAAPGGDSYAHALRELFELDPAAPAAVTNPDVQP